MCKSGFFSGKKNRVILVIRTNFAGTVFLEIEELNFQKNCAKLVRITRIEGVLRSESTSGGSKNQFFEVGVGALVGVKFF